jgi:hypothetical protein
VVDEVPLPEGATEMDFLDAVWQSPQQPMTRRVRVAIELLKYRHARLSVTANFNGFGRRLEAMAASRGMSNVIDATPVRDPEGK